MRNSAQTGRAQALQFGFVEECATVYRQVPKYQLQATRCVGLPLSGGTRPIFAFPLRITTLPTRVAVPKGIERKGSEQNYLARDSQGEAGRVVDLSARSGRRDRFL
jgi:hypothetical protein